MVCYGISATTSGGRRDYWNILRVLIGMPRYTPLSLLGKSMGVVGYGVT